jgi:hypothetical protein
LAREDDMSFEEVDLSRIGVGIDEIESYLNSIDSYNESRKRQICICGHSMLRHSKSSSGSFCSVAKSWCYCSLAVPILEPEDLRPFVYLTDGFGRKHALAKGLESLRGMGKGVKWLIDLQCFKCHSDSRHLILVPLNRDSRVITSSGFTNALLCRECFEEFGGRM